MQAAGYTAGVLGENGPVYFNVAKMVRKLFVIPANEQPPQYPHRCFGQ